MPILPAMLSPLRYPGSKASLVGYVARLLKENYLEGCHFLEPYAGSAALSLGLLQQDIVSRATLVERDPLLFSFWETVFRHPYALIDRLIDLPITIETWQAFQKYRSATDLSEYPLIEMGLAGLFFNRTNFSGILKGGPIGGVKQESQYKIDCRLNKDRLIEQIIELSQLHSKIDVVYDDALEFLGRIRTELKNQECFLYIDPPYYEKGRSLYRYWYVDADHKKLAKYLTRCDLPWLASYDNHPSIRKIYHSANQIEIYFDYTVSRARKERELLISNLEIPPDCKDLFSEQMA